jgi:hypothetical protein
MVKKLLEQIKIGGIHQHDALLVLTDERTGEKRHIWGRNIVTNAGDVWYAQSAASEATTNAFANLYLATACSEAGGTPIKASDYGDFTVHAGSEKAKTATYPKTADADADNTGAGTDIVSWKFEYAAGDGPFVAITHSFIAKAGAGGVDPILNGYKWGATWAKDAFTSAKVFANHEMLGA